MRLPLLIATGTSLIAVAASAEEKRELGSHEHGSGVLNIAVEGRTIAMELEAPGADIVGFEYTAESDADRAAVDTAISDLAKPLEWFVVPAEAGCKVVQASVELLGEEDHEEHDHDHDEEHAEKDHDEHDHEEEHAEKDHDDHDHGEEHAEHDHDEHGHEDAAEAQHTEFHAEYTLDCANPSAMDKIEFVYFDRFPNALELEVQIVSDAGAQAFEVEREDPVLDLRELF